MIKDFIAYYSGGEERFGRIVGAFMEGVANNRVSSFGDVLSRHGSDKWTWHNYALLYELLIEFMPLQINSIFEIGIGTNNTEVIGNMGVGGIPGASLRAWRDFFPSALIYGADYDPDCLFEEPGIKTFYIDQNNPDSIDAAWAVMPHLKFDLVIDDGAHTFEANRNMIEHTYRKVRTGGIYIIEDVILDIGNIKEYHEYFDKRGFDGCFLKIPHNSNEYDNSVIMVMPHQPA